MRYFRDIENDIVYSFDELVEMYGTSLKWDSSLHSMPFCDWLNDCLGKNGSLREIKNPIPRESVDEIRKAVEDFSKAFDNLHKSFSCVSEESFNNWLCDNYPFAYSFDEMPFIVEDWAAKAWQFAACLSTD